MEKKLISLVLAILMMVSILPMSAFAADSLPESEHPYADNVKQRWTYKGKRIRRLSQSDFLKRQSLSKTMTLSIFMTETESRFTGIRERNYPAKQYI